MSVEASAEAAAKAPLVVAKGITKVVADHPGGALVVFAVVVLVVLRYRNSILNLFGMVPVVGTRAQRFGAGQ